MRRLAVISMHTSPLEQPGSGDAGGMNVYILHTARQTARRGIEVDIYTRATRPSQPEVVTVEPNLRVINIVAGPYEGLSKNELSTQLTAFTGGIIDFIRREQTAPYCTIHSHYWLSGQVAWLLRDLWEVPWVHTAHTLAAVKNLNRAVGDKPEPESRRICEQQIVDNADRLVVNTTDETEMLVHHYDAEPERISVVPPGVDLSLFTPGTNRNTERSRRALGIPLDAKVVAFVGRLQPLKGPDVLLKAAAELMRRDPCRNLQVVLCGGPSGNGLERPDEYIELARELKLDGVVRFLRPRPAEELVTVYQAADVVAMPSHSESFGLVSMEAQATGTPVVATRTGGLTLAIRDGETGLLVSGHDPLVWADTLERILENDELRIQMATQAPVHAQQFSWEKSVDMLERVYDGAEQCADQRHQRDRNGVGA